VDIIAVDYLLVICDSKILHQDVSDFGRLRSYGYFLIFLNALVWTARRKTAATWH